MHLLSERSRRCLQLRQLDVGSREAWVYERYEHDSLGNELMQECEPLALDRGGENSSAGSISARAVKSRDEAFFDRVIP
jgi:hypothetical protein